MRVNRSTSCSHCWVLLAAAAAAAVFYYSGDSSTVGGVATPMMTTVVSVVVIAFCPPRSSSWFGRPPSFSVRLGDGEYRYRYSHSSSSSKIWKKKQKRPAATTTTTPSSSSSGERRPTIPLSTLAYVSATEANVRIGPTSTAPTEHHQSTDTNNDKGNNNKEKDKGLGAYAMTSILKGQLVGEYQGEILTRLEVEARYWDLRKRRTKDRRWVKSRLTRNVGMTGDYLFDMDDDLFIDGEDAFVSGWCRFMNHAHESSTECNVETRSTKQIWNGTHYLPPRLYFWATRDIEVGEELSYDYGDEYWD
mmetsp:Transcript_47869/g.116461  ORF Transcript_47869/g.116461 Transcript_47869/m.116461 type:complete len:305 (-) Transcript_47869:449-1363(-)